MNRRALLTLLLPLAACTSNAGDASDSSASAISAVSEVQNFGSNPGELKMYEYVPQHLAPNPPLVVAMHGCMQGASDAAGTGWNTVADELGFVVVYPEQQTNNNQMRCFNWAGEYGDDTNLKRGKGENESIKEMIDKAKAAHGIDPKRVFVTGFSGGGAQAALMAAVWPDIFAAAATFAGVPFDCTTTFSEVSSCLKPGKDESAADWGQKVRAAMPSYTGKWPRMSIWQGSADSVVSPTNRTQLLRQWSNVHGVSEAPTATDTVDGFPHGIWKNGSGEVVMETYEITGMDHGVPIKSAGGKCGSAAQYTLDKGICAARHLAEWFGLGQATTSVGIAAQAQVNGGSTVVSGTVSAPGAAHVASVSVTFQGTEHAATIGSNQAQATFSVTLDTSGLANGSYSATVKATDDAGHTGASDVGFQIGSPPPPPPPTGPCFTAKNSEHVRAGRAYYGLAFHAYALGSNTDLGGASVADDANTSLHQKSSNFWEKVDQCN
jgi:poly(hydroxyalkanoate) depolymerase family esterase